MGGRDSTPSEELLRRAQAGDDSALWRLLRKNRSWLVGLARRWLPRSLARKEDASDLVQDTFGEAVAAFPGFRGAGARTFRGWLRGILHHLCLRAIKYWSRDVRNPERERPLPGRPGGGAEVAAGYPPVVEGLSRQEDAEWLNRALDQLTPDDYRLVQLRFFEDLPFDEIAARLGTKPATLRQQVARVLEKLREGIALLKWMDRQGFVPLRRQALCDWHFKNGSQDRIAEGLNIPK
jgi:RNA polymerase sigma-70 factor (ECF subfamily)